MSNINTIRKYFSLKENTEQFEALTKDEKILVKEGHNLVKKYLGIDKVQAILNDLGMVELALVTGDYARGVDSGLIDLVIVGRVQREMLQHLVDKAEEMIKRKIRVLVLTRDEFAGLKRSLKIDKALVVWKDDSAVQ